MKKSPLFEWSVDMFSYEIKQQGAKTIVTLDGDLDIDVTEIMEDEIAPALSGSSLIHIDFSAVAFVDSSGIGLLITLIRDIHEAGHTVLIVNVSVEVMYVFSMLQLQEIVGHDVFADI
jgi:anti-anti-sigma factor